jgi:ribosomal RNA-processing protein 36
MRGRISHRGAAPNSVASTSTSGKRDPEYERAVASEESGDEEVSPTPSRFSLNLPLVRRTLTGGSFGPQQEDASSSSGSESESDGDGLAEREQELERALADVPFGELQRARADGSLAARGASAAAAAQQKKARRESRKRSGSTPCCFLLRISQFRGMDVS